MANIISVQNNHLNVPDNTVIPFIEGDGIGRDVWHAAKYVIDSAVQAAYPGKRKIDWLEVYAGEKAHKKFNSWLPDDTLKAFDKYLVGIKGPLTTPVGKGFHSLNVTLRQKLDLYVCLRPVKYFEGIETPMKHPEKVNMVIFRENTEDIYTGIEFKAGTKANKKLLKFIRHEFPDEFEKIKFGTLESINDFQKLSGQKLSESVELGIGLKINSREGSERLVIAAINYAIEHNRKSVTLVHKGNIMKYTSGAFRDWGYAAAAKMFRNKVYTMMQWELCKNESGTSAANKEMQDSINEGKIIIKDAIADNALQQVLLSPESFDIIATENLNGDYLSDAIAAQVGGIGIAPGGNINFISGHAIFEATHGTAPSLADTDTANPSSLILSGSMMLEYLGWKEASDLIENGLRNAIKSKHVTMDFAHFMKDAVQLKCSEFGEEIVKNFSEINND